MRERGDKPFRMEEEEEEVRENRDDVRQRSRWFASSFFLPLLFFAVLFSVFLSDSTRTTTRQHFLSASGHVNYVGRRGENLGHQESTNDGETNNNRFDENENRETSFHDLFGNYFFGGGKP